MKDSTEKKSARTSRTSRSKAKTEDESSAPMDEAARVASDIQQSGQTLFDDAGNFIHSAHDGLEVVQSEAARHAQERPYILVASAIGVGFVLGGGLTFRVTKTLVNIGGRLLLSAMAKEVMSRANLA